MVLNSAINRLLSRIVHVTGACSFWLAGLKKFDIALPTQGQKDPKFGFGDGLVVVDVVVRFTVGGEILPSSSAPRLREDGKITNLSIAEESGRVWTRFCRMDALKTTLETCWMDFIQNVIVCNESRLIATCRRCMFFGKPLDQFEKPWLPPHDCNWSISSTLSLSPTFRNYKLPKIYSNTKMETSLARNHEPSHLLPVPFRTHVGHAPSALSASLHDPAALAKAASSDLCLLKLPVELLEMILQHLIPYHKEHPLVIILNAYRVKF